MALGLHANRSTGHCYPGLDLLAAEACMLRRNVHRNLRILIKTGLLRINPDGTYTVIYDEEDDAAHLSPETAHLSPETAHLSPETAHLSPETAPYIEEQPIEQPKRTAHSNSRVCAREDRSINGVEVVTPQVAKASDQFERLWHAYPSRPDDPKEPARDAFAEVVAAGADGGFIVAAAERYAGWVTLDSAGPAYAPHLHRWLREGRYQHEGKAWPRPRGLLGAVVDVVWHPLRRSEVEPEKPRPTPQVDDAEWRKRLEKFRGDGALARDWPKEYGPPPTHVASRVPRYLRDEFGFV